VKTVQSSDTAKSDKRRGEKQRKCFECREEQGIETKKRCLLNRTIQIKRERQLTIMMMAVMTTAAV
jgi:hypothetical protein